MKCVQILITYPFPNQGEFYLVPEKILSPSLIEEMKQQVYDFPRFADPEEEGHLNLKQEGILKLILGDGFYYPIPEGVQITQVYVYSIH